MTELLAKTLAPDYNCAHYACDVFEQETGFDMRRVLVGFLAPHGQREASVLIARDMRRIHAPVSPCIVLFRRVKATPHVGVFLRGRVQHLTDSGPIRQLLALASLGYTSVRFYAPR